MRFLFALLDEKQNLLYILRKLSKMLKKFVRKLRKTHYFSIFFKRNLTNHAFIFCAFGGQRQCIANFEKVFFGILLKCIILEFSNKLTRHALIFCAFGRKTQTAGKFCENFEFFDENSIEKLNFIIIIFSFSIVC